MRHPFLRRTRPMSAGELRELYGVPVHNINNCEESFRKEVFHRDRHRLKVIVGAIDQQKRKSERAWDLTKSKFVRQHKHIIDPPKKKVVYRKVGTVSMQPENTVPPCIPFIGTFPPTRHPSKERRLSEMFKEPLFSCSTLAFPDSFKSESEEQLYKGEEEEDNYAFYLANRRVSGSLGPGIVRRTSDGGTEILQRKSSSASGPIPTVDNESKNRRKSASSTGHGGASRRESVTAGSKRSFSTQRSRDGVRNANRTPQNDQQERTTGFARESSKTPQNDQQERTTRFAGESSKTSGEDTPSKRSDLTSKSDTTSAGSLDVELLQQALVAHANQNLARSRWHRATDRMKFPVHEEPPTLRDTDLRVESVLSWGSVSTPTTRTATDISDYQHDTNMVVIQTILKVFKELDGVQVKPLEEVWPDKMKLLEAEIEHLSKYSGLDVTEIIEKIQTGDIYDEKAGALLDWIQNIDGTAVGNQGATVKNKSTDQPQQPNTNSAVSVLESTDNNDLNGNLDASVGASDDIVTASKTTSDLIFETQSEIHSKSSAHPLPRATPASNSAEVPSVPHNLRQPPVINVIPPTRRESRAVDKSKSNGRSAGVERSKNNGPSTGVARSRSIGHSAGVKKSSSNGQNTSVHLSQLTSLSRRSSASSDSSSSKRNLASLPQAPCTSNDAALLYQMKNKARRAHSTGSRDEQTESSVTSTFKRLSISSTGTATAGNEQTTSETCFPELQADQDTSSSRKSAVSNNSLTTAGHCTESRRKLSSHGKSPQRPLDDYDNSPQGTRKISASEQSSNKPPSASANSPENTECSLLKTLEGVAGSKQKPDSVSSQPCHPVRINRKVSFSAVSRLRSASIVEDTELHDENTGTKRRDSRAASISRSVSTDSQDSLQCQSFRRRAYTTGQQYPLRNASRESLLPRRNSDEDSRRKSSLHSSTYGQRRLTTEGNATSDNLTFPEDTTGGRNRKESIETVVSHTDRQGRTHLLTMQKTPFGNESRREANVVVTRQDSSPSLKPRQNSIYDVDSKTVIPDVEEYQDVAADEVFHEVPQSNANDNKSTHIGENENFKSEQLDSEQKPSEKAYELQERKKTERRTSKESENLWKKRLAHPRGMSWVQELSSDHVAQGIALSLLRRKKGGGPQFRSTVLSVICINALRAAKGVHDDDCYRDLRKCRYLRMPSRYTADVQRELGIQEIFS